MATRTATHTIGIDLGGTKILTGIVNARNEMVATVKTPTNAQEGAQGVLDRIIVSLDQALVQSNLSKSDIRGVGIGVPGVFDAASGVIIRITNIDGMENVNMAQLLSTWHGGKIKTVLSNDVRVATWGEYQLGAGKGHKNMVAIWVGTGIGGGIILNGKVLEGSRGSAGEVGHVVTLADGPFAAGAGVRGGIEALASRTAIERDLRRAIADGTATILPQILAKNENQLKSGVLRKAVRKGDALTISVLERAAYYLGLHCASVVNMLDPEIVVYGGGLMENLGDWMIERIAPVARRNFINKSNLDKISLVATSLGEPAGALGAALLARG